MVQQTSLEAWYEVKDSLGERQLELLKVFKDNPDKVFTDQELSVRLGLPINCITPRRLELERMKLINCVGKVQVYYAKTNRSVMTFKLITT